MPTVDGRCRRRATLRDALLLVLTRVYGDGGKKPTSSLSRFRVSGYLNTRSLAPCPGGPGDPIAMSNRIPRSPRAAPAVYFKPKETTRLSTLDRTSPITHWSLTLRVLTVVCTRGFLPTATRPRQLRYISFYQDTPRRVATDVKLKMSNE